jgi:ABC-type multidrug transport system fused ATPase/permease subunit
MINQFSNVLNLINKKQRKFFYILCFLETISIFLDVIGIALIPIFLSYLLMVNTPFESFNFIFIFKDKLNFANSNINYFIYIILLVYILKFLFSLLFAYISERFNKIITNYFSLRLYEGYLSLPYKSYFDFSSSNIQRNIIMEVNSVYKSLMCFSNIFKDIVLIFFIITLFILNKNNDFYLILVVMLIFSILFYLILRKLISKVSLDNQIKMGELLRNVKYIVLGIKEVILLKKNDFFIDYYKNKHKIYLNNNFIKLFVQKIPRLVLELIIVATTLLIMAHFINKNMSGEEIIVSITFLILASIKLAPCFNSITVSANSLSGLKPSTDLIGDQLRYIEKNKIPILKSENFFGKNIFNIKFSEVNFNYSNRDEKVINNLNVNFQKGNFIGISGKTGSGKSTFINLLVGLLTPNQGNVTVNNKSILGQENDWHPYIAYISQEAFIFEDTIKANITFGTSSDNIDYKKLDQILRCCELKEFIDYLPNGLETHIGENAINISGGQKQRINIARGLYLDREILVLDEATNSIDIHLEKKILENIKNLYDKKIVFMVSHDSENFQQVNKIILFEKNMNSKIFDTYQEFKKYYI